MTVLGVPSKSVLYGATLTSYNVQGLMQWLVSSEASKQPLNVYVNTVLETLLRVEKPVGRISLEYTRDLFRAASKPL